MNDMYCPWQKDISSIKAPSNYTQSGNTYINTTIKFGECLKDKCPFYCESSYPNCKRAISEVKIHE